MNLNADFKYELMAGPSQPNKTTVDACGPYGDAEMTDQVCGTSGDPILGPRVSRSKQWMRQATEYARLKAAERAEKARGVPEYEIRERARANLIFWGGYLGGCVSAALFFWVYVA